MRVSSGLVRLCLIAIAATAGCSSPGSGSSENLGALGASCTRSPDCAAPLQCVENVCTATGADAQDAVDTASDTAVSTTTATSPPDTTTTTTTSPPDTTTTTGSSDTTTTGGTTSGADTSSGPGPVAYYAIFVEDLWDRTCRSSSGQEGADIDAVELFDEAGHHVAYLDTVDAERSPTICSNMEAHADPRAATGAPDGSLTDHAYSLWGGWLIGEFEFGVELTAGDRVQVFEIDDSYCQGIPSCLGSEKYEVYLATELDCVNQGEDFRDTCMIKLTAGGGALGSITIELSGF
ncbi:MAG: hypothetical protein KC635_09375 [Myxococcales bacterium]|nr:hypothetical protein [Myxococcales bacterium]MCB9733105.1 hypothetical protein [Deltaproteobacteria bacterium]